MDCCPKCGKKAEGKFCEECGAKLGVPEKHNVKKIIIIGVIIALIGGFLFLSFSGILFTLNNWMPHNPDTSCKSDYDCELSHLKLIKCHECDPCVDIPGPGTIAINKNWKPFCPFPKSPMHGCTSCSTMFGGEEGEPETLAKCVANKCEVVPPKLS